MGAKFFNWLCNTIFLRNLILIATITLKTIIVAHIFVCKLTTKLRYFRHLSHIRNRICHTWSLVALLFLGILLSELIIYNAGRGKVFTHSFSAPFKEIFSILEFFNNIGG